MKHLTDEELLQVQERAQFVLDPESCFPDRIKDQWQKKLKEVQIEQKRREFLKYQSNFIEV